MCPEWIERCVHFGDLILYLGTSERDQPCKFGCSEVGTFNVGVHDGYEQCPRDDCDRSWISQQYQRLAYVGDDRDEALAVFRQEEACLLGQEFP